MLFKSMPFWLASCTLLVAGLLIVQTKAVSVSQKTYLIKGRQLDGQVDASTQLRQFLPESLSVTRRCQRYGIMLKEVRSLNLFDLIEIATLDGKTADAKFATISIDELRKLYIDSIESFLKANRVNAAMLELYNCLKKDFSSRDAVARSFLNNPALKQIIDQYESITSQPARLLDGGQHPTLKLEELDETVKNSVARWLGQGRAELGQLFQRGQQRAGPTARAQASAQQGAAASSQVSLQQEPVDFGVGHASAQAASSVTHPAEAPQLTDDDMNYLSDVFAALIETYETLPVETPENERCRTYSELVEVSQDHSKLHEPGLVGKLVAKAAKRIPRTKPNVPFVPGQEERGNFLFLLQVLYPDEHGADVWLDMLNCAYHWGSVDKEVSEFLNGEQLDATLAELKASGGEAAAPHQQ